MANQAKKRQVEKGEVWLVAQQYLNTHKDSETCMLASILLKLQIIIRKNGEGSEQELAHPFPIQIPSLA